MSFGGGIGEIASAEMALALRRRAARAESRCVLADVPALYRPVCPCWPCRLGRAREVRRARIAGIKARLRLRAKAATSARAAHNEKRDERWDS